MSGKKLLSLLTSRSRLCCATSTRHPARSTLLPPHCEAVLRGARAFTTNADSLSITDNCAKRLQEIIKEEGGNPDEKMLRVSVEGGGCSGFQYVFALDGKLSKSDRVFVKDGVKVVVDDISMDFVKGATIDYVEELIRASFMVTENPNASGGCGCGSSFNVKS